MTRIVLSLCVIARNEEANLRGLLVSVRPLADEVVVVDTGSRDRTVQVAREQRCRVYEQRWQDDFSLARNTALDRARGEWCLTLDADDRLLPLGRACIERVLRARARGQTPALTGYSFGIEERTRAGAVLGVAASSTRLFPNRPYLRYRGRVHEEIADQRGAPCTWGLLPGVHIAHTGYDPALLPAKWARNRRLLLLRLSDDPHDVWALYYLAIQASQQGNADEARTWATDALELADPRLTAEHRDRLTELVDTRGKEKA